MGTGCGLTRSLDPQKKEELLLEEKKEAVREIKHKSREAAREIAKHRELERARAMRNKESIRREQEEQRKLRETARVSAGAGPGRGGRTSRPAPALTLLPPTRRCAQLLQLEHNKRVYEERVRAEEQKRAEEEQRVRALEEEEMRLIRRLQDTTEKQESAYGRLEVALRGTMVEQRVG